MAIVKTRQCAGDPKTVQAPGPSVPTPAKSRGVLRLPPGGVTVPRHSPTAVLAPFVAYYWRVSWDLRGRPPHLQETLPHPNIYLVFENNRLQLSGVSTTRFTRILEGQGFAFGVKFRPGGFRPFLKSSVSSLTNCVVPASHVFGPDADALETILSSCVEQDDMVRAVESFLLRRVPALDDRVVLADGIVGQIFHQPQIRTVDDLASHTGISKRSLQRIFREYVGISPKWVIQRYRLHELIDRLEAGEPLNWPDLALELGYFDQAHLINDFRTITGYSPADYQRR
jgi:AraC-like DNA-binding protein